MDRGGAASTEVVTCPVEKLKEFHYGHRDAFDINWMLWGH